MPHIGDTFEQTLPNTRRNKLPIRLLQCLHSNNSCCANTATTEKVYQFEAFLHFPDASLSWCYIAAHKQTCIDVQLVTLHISSLSHKQCELLLCMCVCTCLCMHVLRMCVRMCVSMYVCICKYTMYVCIMYVYISMHLYMHECMHAHIYTCMCIYLNTYIYIYNIDTYL